MQGRNFDINRHNYIECPLLDNEVQNFDQFEIKSVQKLQSRMCPKHSNLSAKGLQVAESAKTMPDFAFKKVVLDIFRENIYCQVCKNTPNEVFSCPNSLCRAIYCQYCAENMPNKKNCLKCHVPFPN